MAGIAFEPVLYYIVVELLRPEHSGKALAHDILCVSGKIVGNNCSVKVVCLILAKRQQSIESFERSLRAEVNVGEAQPSDNATAGRYMQLVMCRGFGPHRHGSDCIFFVVHDVIVDSVLHACAMILDTIQPLVVGFVFREEDFRCAVAIQPSLPQGGVVKFYPVSDTAHIGPLGIVSPQPGITEPDSWK